MRKKIVLVPLFSLILALLIFVPWSEDVKERHVYVGVDAEILDIDKENRVLTILGTGKGNDPFQGETRVDCRSLEEDGKIIKSNDKDDLVFLAFSDLKVKDKIKINVEEEELNRLNEEESGPIKIEQIELVEEK